MKWTTVFALACALTPMAAAPSPPGAFQPQLYFPPPSPPRHLPHPSLDTPFAHAASTLSSSDYGAHDGMRLGDARRDREENVGVGHFSEWARETKESFLDALREDRAQEWTIVMGNEGGDLDSMVSALTYAYYLMHQPVPVRAIALLQTEADALDLRPENKLCLAYARMSTGHKDLLTLDELPIQPWDLWHRIKGVVLVDHNFPRQMWGNVSVLSIIDHHDDRNLLRHARPRIIQVAASCSSLVSRLVLDAREKHHLSSPSPSFHGPLPIELVDLLLRTIALDSDGLDKDSSQKVDKKSAERLLAISSWKGQKLKDVMQRLGKEIKKSKKGLGELVVRDLLRRDWKGDAIATKSARYPFINLGLASVPYSMNEMISRTPEGTAPEWFAIERAWTAEIHADVSVALTNYRDAHGQKVKEVALVVAHGWGKRLDEAASNRLFKALTSAMENAPEFKVLEKWERPDGKPLLPRRAVWRHYNGEAGRKLLRPIFERAVREWEG